MPQQNKDKSFIIGITGGLATGKSTVSDILRKQNHVVICADAIAHDVVKKEKPAYNKIIRFFGTTILTPNKDINRHELAKIVFSNSTKLHKLEEIIHPHVRREIKNLITFFKDKGFELIFIDVPLLFEAGFDKLCDKTLCISSPKNIQLRRVKEFRGWNRKNALSRMMTQMPLKEKAKRADYVIKNTGSKEDLENLVVAWLEQLGKELEIA
jgi:dephospho-CoA kinase